MEELELADHLSTDSIFLTPTDTVWGIGADATNYANYLRIQQVKQRPSSTNFVLLMKDVAMVEHYLGTLQENQKQVLTQSPNPTTLLIPYRDTFPMECKPKNSDFVAIRIPKHPLCLAIIDQLDKPIISTSANLHQQPTPTSFEQISTEIKTNVDFIFGEKHPMQGTGKSSAIVKLNEANELEFLRL